MKKIFIFILFIVILLLSSCSNKGNKTNYEYINNPPTDPENMEEYYRNLKPIINEYTGEKFVIGGDITIGGYYKGYERLGQDIIYCNDENSVIWNDRSMGMLKKTNASNKTEKLCIFRECRDNLDIACRHVSYSTPFYYSNGIIYSWAYCLDEDFFIINKTCIYSYDIYSNSIDKLIEFENSYPYNIEIFGRYIYVWLADVEVGSDWQIIRIDIEQENAVVIYSSDENVNIVSGIRHKLYLTGDRFLSPVGNNISRVDLDFQSSSVLLEMDINLTIIPYFLCMYNDDIYYLCNDAAVNDWNNKKLYKYNPKMDKPELLADDIYDINISGDFLYYTLYEPYEAYRYNAVAYDEDYDEYLSGNIVPETLYNGNAIYRIKLDYGYFNFREKVEIYRPEKGYYIGEWKVHNDYIYTTLYTDGDFEYIKYYENLVRVKVNSSSPSNVFYKSEVRQSIHSMKKINSER